MICFGAVWPAFGDGVRFSVALRAAVANVLQRTCVDVFTRYVIGGRVCGWRWCKVARCPKLGTKSLVFVYAQIPCFRHLNNSEYGAAHLASFKNEGGTFAFCAAVPLLKLKTFMTFSRP